MNRQVLKEHLISWFKGHGAWHDDGTMVIHDEEHLHEFCEELAAKIWDKMCPPAKYPKGTKEGDLYVTAFNRGWDVGYDFATNPDKADLRKKAEELEKRKQKNGV